MNEAREVVVFLDNCIKMGAKKAYLTKEDYDLLLSSEASWSFRRYRTKTRSGKYKNRLVVMTAKN